MKLNSIELIDDALNYNDSTQVHKGIMRIVNNTDILGLEDSIELKKRFSSVKCISPTGELFKIQMQVFEFNI
jgi:hypothetical protein